MSEGQIGAAIALGVMLTIGIVCDDLPLYCFRRDVLNLPWHTSYHDLDRRKLRVLSVGMNCRDTAF